MEGQGWRPVDSHQLLGEAPTGGQALGEAVLDTDPSMTVTPG